MSDLDVKAIRTLYETNDSEGAGLTILAAVPELLDRLERAEARIAELEEEQKEALEALADLTKDGGEKSYWNEQMASAYTRSVYLEANYSRAFKAIKRTASTTAVVHDEACPARPPAVGDCCCDKGAPQ